MARFHKFFMQELGEDLYTDLLRWTRDPRKQAKGSFSFYTVNHHFQLELDQMARKRKGTNNAQTSDAATTGEALVWINVKLEADEVQWITELTGNADQVGTRLAGLLIMGVGFSVKSNPLRSNFSAFIVGLELDGIGKNCGISAYAPDALTATCAVLAKAAILQADQSRGAASGQSMGIG